jgi:hypothetical protein
MAEKFDPTELRLSESAGCARRWVLTALEFPATHPETNHNAGILHAGHILEARVVEAYRRRFGARLAYVSREKSPPVPNHLKDTGHGFGAARLWQGLQVPA